MSNLNLQPFADETTSLTLGELTIENRLDRLELYGRLAITRDQAGLALARELFGLANAIAASLEADQAAGKLPARIDTEPPVPVANPFH